VAGDQGLNEGGRNDGGAVRCALVTGGASGLGRAVAVRLLERGWRVALADIDAEAAAAAARGIDPAGTRILALRLDVRSDEEWTAAVGAVDGAWGRIDLLVQSAGVASSGTIEETPIDQWRWVLEINLLGIVRGCRAVVPGMRTRRSGHVVNVASFAGLANAPSMASYNAAKAAVISLSETLRAEVAGAGIGVSVACPAFIKTPLMETTAREAASAGSGEADARNAARMQAIVRHLMETSGVTAEDFARDVVDAVERRRFMVITHRDARWKWRLKRLAPEWFFREVVKTTRKFLG
jgi:NAD(P)-dependent dehydrogenase (short-subunit alcohol dehydrogenase family)